MRVCGIIAEFNPLHNGHNYLLQQAREQYHADYIIIIMSGDHVQRGEPAIIDKYTRTKSALLAGADLVFELPVSIATGSSGYFAKGSVAALLSTGMVDFILFGSESGDLTMFYDAIDTEAEERYNAERLPNNQLGIEYLKAYSYLTGKLPPRSFFQTLKRVGAGYHDRFVTDSFCSATYLREQMLTKSTSDISALVPDFVSASFLTYFEKYRIMSMNEYSSLLYYALLRDRLCGYSKYFDVYPDLSDKIAKHFSNYTDVDSFRSSLKSKDITYSHISRALLHILLNLQKSTFDLLANHYNYCAYLRILGMNKSASDLLHGVKQNCAVPLITKLADAKSYLPEQAFSILTQDIDASTLYQYVANKENACIHNEYRQNVIITTFPRN